MRRLATVALVLLLVAVGILAIVSCESVDNAAARRAAEEAAQLRAEAEAYQVRQQADTEAAAERANVRQMERDAAHQRTLEMLPFVLAIGGGILVLVLAGLAFWDLRARRQTTPAADPALLLYLERQRLDQAQLWRAIATLDRRSLVARGNDAREVVIYDNWRR